MFTPATSKHMKKIYLLSLILLLTLAATAQRKATDRADKLFDKFNYAEALEEYFYALERDSTDVHTNRMIGLCFRKLGLIAKSTEWFEQVIDLSAAEPDDKLHYAEGLRASGSYDRAVFWYRRFAYDKPDDSRANRHLNNPMYYNNLLADSLRYTLTHLDINTDKPSFGMGRLNDRYVFSSAGVKGYGGKSHSDSELAFLDIYVCDLDDDGEIIHAEPLTGAVNSKFHDGPASFDATTQTMYVTRNNMKGGRPVYDKSGTANLKIYSFDLINDTWKEAPELPFNSDEYSVGHPTVSPDGSFMIFVSNRPGGYGGTDLYIAYREETGWSEPQNLGAEINTEGSEMFPFISERGNLYFSSDGHAGLGGLDVFTASRRIGTEHAIFEDPQNLGAPINSTADDFSITYDETAETGYFSSNRGGLGQDNLYHFTLKKFSHQIFAATFSTDEQTSLASRQVRLRTLSSGQDSLMRLDETGTFRALVKAGENYAVFIGAESVENETAVLHFDVDDVLTETYRFDGSISISREPLLLAGFVKERSLAIPTFDFTAQTGGAIRDRLNILRESSGMLSKAEFDAFAESDLVDDSELEQMMAVQSEEIASLNQSLVEQRLNNLHFGFDSYGIRSAERQKITALAEVLTENSDAHVIIKAHTDSRGDENYNLVLSMRRAKSVQKALVSRGINLERIKIAWVGSNELLVDCGAQPCSQADHAMNRRAEIVVIHTHIESDAATEVATD